MRVTLLGHASLLVELEGATCLMDPVFDDPFEEGAVVSCPKRSVCVDKLPPVDLLVVSHRHPDHFDIPSLARVPKGADAICPADPLLVYALEELGFPRVHPVHPMAPILSATFELFPTRSEVTTVKEFGVVFRDRSGTLWNQVDTSLSADTIRLVGDRFGRVDLLLAMYASQNFDFFENRGVEFPYRVHAENLANVLRIAPRAVAPGSAGFRFSGDREWLNPFLFPVSRERFLADLARLDPALAAFPLDPGDVVDIGDGAVRRRPGASTVAVMEEEDTARIRFDPTAPVPDLADPNPEGVPVTRLAAGVERCVAGLAAYVRRGYGEGGDRVVDRYRRLSASYAVGGVLPDGRTLWTRLVFAPDRPAVEQGEGGSDADVVHRIAASALVDWMEHRKSFFYVRAYSRRASSSYRIAREGEAVVVEAEPLPDLLMHYVLNVAEGSERAAKAWVDRGIEDALRRTPAHHARGLRARLGDVDQPVASRTGCGAPKGSGRRARGDDSAPG